MISVDDRVEALRARLLHIYSSRRSGVLYALLYAVARILRGFDEDFEIALAQVSLMTARGMWLNLWGAWFGVRRQTAETDVAYGVRIIESIRKPKCSRQAILDAVNENEELASMTITLDEHWVDRWSFGSSYIGYSPSGRGLVSPAPARLRSDDQIAARLSLYVEPFIPTEHYFWIGWSGIGLGADHITGKDAFLTNAVTGISMPAYRHLVRTVDETKVAGVEV